MKCFRCNFWLRPLDKSIQLYECSNPRCNVIIQLSYAIKQQKQKKDPQQTISQSVLAEEVK